MAVIDHNVVHPVSAVHSHPGHPSEGSRAIHNSTPSLIDPVHLAQHMNRLNVDGERVAQRNKQNAKSSPAVESIPRTPLYLGYIFSKSSATPGQKPTWGRAERSPLHMSQTELLKMVQKRASKTPSDQQYSVLSKVKRAHVERLLEDHRRNDPRFDWSCVYAKEEERPFKGKNSRRGDYETVAVEVIIMRVPAAPSIPKAPTNGAVHPEHFKPEERVIEETKTPLNEEEPTPVNHNTHHTVQWAKPEVQYAPAMMNPVQRPHPSQFHQNPPPPPPTQGPMMDRRYLPPQGPWLQMPPVDVHQQPGLFGVPRADFGNGPMGAPIQSGPRPAPLGPGIAFHPGRRPDHGHAPYAAHAKNGFPKPDFANATVHQERTPNPVKVSAPAERSPERPVDRHVERPIERPIERPVERPVERPIERPIERSIERPVERPVERRAESQPGLPLKDNPVDDDSELSDSDDESIATEESEEVAEKSQPWRGSLYRRDSSPKQDDEDLESAYRSHSRKQPNKKNALVVKPAQSRYQTGYADVVPETSKDTSEQLLNDQPRDFAVQGTRGRPKVIQESVSPTLVDPAVQLDDRLRGRTRNDIRTRILDDREARLERREKLIDYRARMLDDKLEEARYLDRFMTLRDPSYFCSHRHTHGMRDGFY
ncbi:hypothetical protein MW887_002153 [Aspergillus wentii]|nr:hypothetical protein MW887_002153 [Aspergillus wentii]